MKQFSLLMLMVGLTFTLPAQSWQWGRHGGSIGSFNFNPQEEVIDIATDPHGNVYLITTLYTFMRFLGGSQNTLYTGPGFGLEGAVLVSYDCEGSFRWAKTFATTPGGGALADALAVDEVGGVYVATYMRLNVGREAKIDVDTSFTAPLREVVLIKYDTSGVFQWVRNPVPDTTTQRQSRMLTMSATTDGHLYAYGAMQAGLLAGSDSVVIDSTGPHVLHYDLDGNLLEAIPLEFEAMPVVYPRHFARDHRSGRFYVCGQYNSTLGSLSLGGQPVSGTNYVGAFDSTGQFLWLRENTSPFANGFRDDPQVDQQGNVYLVGTSSRLDTFAGYEVLNSVSNIGHNLPVVFCLDSDGNLVWGRNGSTNSATDGDAIAITEINGVVNEVAIGGSFPGRLVWAGDTLNSPLNYSYDAFLARFDANGNSLGLTSLPSTFGASDFATALTADRNGNFYLGGRMAGSGELYVGPDTLDGYGGNFDFFVAKFGSDNCAICSDPVAGAATSYDSSSLSVAFQFTGAANYDSLSWTFGDGSTDTAANPTHAYAQPGVYLACVRVFNACGSDSVCLSTTVCTPPVADFAAQDSFLQVAFDASGSSYDSLRWTFGDGTTDTALAPVHTYAQPGSYTVCLQAYTLCGVDRRCDTLVVETAVGIAQRQGYALQLRPNPSAGPLAVAYALPQPGGSLTLYDAQGRALRTYPLTQPQGVWQAELGDLPAGIYLVVLRQGTHLVAQQKLSLSR
jgi:PKD repeat protein